MKKSILFLSYRWEDERLQNHSSDRMMSFGFQDLGHEIFYHDYREYTKLNGMNENQNEIYRKIMNIKPDILFITKGEKIDPRTIKRAKKDGFKGIVIGWYNDARLKPVSCVVDIMKECDWFFHCKGGWKLKEYYQLTKTPTSLLLSPYEPDFIIDKPIEERSLKVTWYGQLYDPKRGFDSIRRDIIPDIRHLLDDYGACFDKTFIRGEEYYSCLGNSLMSISIPAIDLPMYFSNRHSHIMGSGCVPLSYSFEGYDTIFTEGHDIIAFRDSKELIQKVDYYLNNIGELKQISENSRSFAKKYMCSVEVAKEIINVLKTGLSSYSFRDCINPENKKFL